ncbi:MAG TPA: TolC family protein, partial [Bacteroidia bacterium]|nr:TolC family protein [Bacteroidia bacterium]
KGYLPQLSFNGQVTYQSDVTKIPISFSLPGVDLSIPTISKTQFNVHGEIDQTIYDGGAIKQQQQLYGANTDAQQQNIEVQLYALKDRVNQLYFGALLIEQQLKQNSLIQKDIQNSIDRMQVSVNNGVALKSNIDEMQAELFQQQQNEISLKATQKAYLDMLGLFINLPLDENTQLQAPLTLTVSDSIHRPELSFYDFQRKSNLIQARMLNVGLRPKFLFFFQAGYALPGLNGFNVDPAPFYITGLRLSWSLGNFYTIRNQRQLLNIDRQNIDIQRDLFLFNTHIALKQQNADIIKLQQMIDLDNNIISKRTAVKNAAKVQLDNGTTTVHDYISELDAEDQAKQNLLLHQMQLIMAEYAYRNTAGN